MAYGRQAFCTLLFSDLFSFEPLLLYKLHQVLYAGLLRAAELLSVFTQILHSPYHSGLARTCIDLESEHVLIAPASRVYLLGRGSIVFIKW